MAFKQWFLNLILRLFPKHDRDGTPKKRYAGVLKDKPDTRDYSAKLVVEQVREKPLFYQLPIDPYKYVKNQLTWNSCASHAMATGIEIMHEIGQTQKAGVELSERYHYYKARQYIGKLPQNVGMTMRDMLKMAQWDGICPEKICPYISSEMNLKPGYFADSFASWWKIQFYYRVNDIDEIKDTLLDNKVVLVGSQVNDSFRRNQGDIYVGDNDNLYGGHAYVIYGYDDVTGEFLCINWWSKKYKDKGIMRVPYDYMNRYAFDYWTFTVNV